MPTPPSTAEPTWLGHPRGLVVLFVAEMWERMNRPVSFTLTGYDNLQNATVLPYTLTVTN